MNDVSPQVTGPLKSPRCPTRLVPDEPSEQDDFGPHRSIAEAIAELVREELGGRCIALIGKWGAGKSTVIGILNQLLSVDADCRVWVFDAWAHEGAPLRRTFLESLIRFFRTPPWIDELAWKNRADELAGRRSVREERDIPQISKTGWVLLFAVISFPIGIALLNHGLQVGVLLPGAGRSPNVSFLAGMLILASPLWIALSRWTWTEVGFRIAKRKGGTPEKPDHAALLAVVAQKILTYKRTHVSESPEPTSLEFEATFSALMREALHNQRRRLVLVLDNLDRIDAADALKVWSTLQTFIHHGPDREAWIGRIWVILPFDRDSILKLWSHTPDKTPGLATSVLDKSFQIAFEVPDPLLSDWKRYLFATLATALPTHEQRGDFASIYRLISLRFSRSGRIPTPREIKAIVNQIGALHRQHQDSIPLAQMALFVLLQRDGVKVVKSLIDQTTPDPEEIGLLGHNPREGLAALAFGVERARALQLLLEAPIIDALAQPNAERLVELRSSAEGFEEVLEQSVTRAGAEWPSAEGGKLLHAVVALHDSGLLDSVPSTHSGSLFRTLADASRRIVILAPLTTSAERGLLLLAERAADPGFAKLQFATYAHAIQSSTGDQLSARLPQRVVSLAKSFHSAGYAAATVDGVQLPGGVEQYFEAVRVLLAEGDEQARPYWGVLRPMAGPKQVVASLASIVTNGRCASYHVEVIRLQRPAITVDDWAPVIDALEERLDAANSAVAEELETLLAALEVFSDMISGRGVRATLASNGHLGHHIHTATTEGHMLALARCIYSYMTTFPDLAPQARIAKAASGYTHLQQHLASPPTGLPHSLASVILGADAGNVLIQVLEQAPLARSLVGQTLGVIAAGSSLTDLFTPEFVLDHWELLDEYSDLGSVVATAGADKRLSMALRGTTLSNDNAKLVHALIQRGPEDALLRDWCVDQLRSIDDAQWREQLEGRGALLALASECEAKGADVALGRHFRDAINRMAKSAADDDTAAADWDLAVASILKLLESSERGVLRDQLYGILKDNPQATSSAFFELFGAEVVASAAMRRDPLFPTLVPEKMMKSRNEPGLRWLAAALKESPKLMQGSDANHLSAFKRDLAAELRDGPPDAAHEEVKAIAAVLGVVPAAPPDKH